MIFMTIGNQLRKNLENSSGLKRKLEEFNNNLKNFYQNNREEEYHNVQKRMEAIIKKTKS